MKSINMVSFVLEDQDKNNLIGKKPSQVFLFEGTYIVVFLEEGEPIFTTAYNDEHNQTIISDDLEPEFRRKIEQYYYDRYSSQYSTQ